MTKPTATPAPMPSVKGRPAITQVMAPRIVPAVAPTRTRNASEPRPRMLVGSGALGLLMVRVLRSGGGPPERSPPPQRRGRHALHPAGALIAGQRLGQFGSRG